MGTTIGTGTFDGVAFALKAMSGSIMSRHSAADILRQVADDVSWGGFPQDVSPHQLGYAIGRAMINCSNGKGLRGNLIELAQGFWAYAREHPESI